jgi:hypothetical protein
MKCYADNKVYVKPSTIGVGDAVLLKNSNPMKSDLPFQPTPLIVTKKKGSMITAQRGDQMVTRNSSFFKPSPRRPTAAETEPELPENDAEAENSATSNSPQAYNSDRNSAHDTQTPITMPRRSSRVVCPPKKFDDYVMI